MRICAVKLDVNFEKHMYDDFLSMVNDHKRARINRFVRFADALRSLTADVTARYMICSEANLFNHDIRIETNVYGKPMLQHPRHLVFNVSHSGNWVVCAVHTGDVGIDIEQVQFIELAVAKRFFTFEEYQFIVNMPPEEQLSCFYQIWTMKESFIKAIGKGLYQPLHSFSVNPLDGGSSVCWDNGQMSYYFKQYAIDPLYMMSACSKDNDFPDQVEIMDMKQIHSKSKKMLKTE